ncbi:MAG: dienelactone hydrolase [Candidatus Omnitrophota bacterium]|nr:dienelactone hydrolase [Candidatus Omnitrophota bacterium]
MTEKVTFELAGGTVSGVWHHPHQGKTYVVLAHGAGGNLHTPGLVHYAEALAARGVGAVRFNFPYAEARRKIPDPPPRLEACFRTVAEEVRSRAAALYLGGRSMGGRIASHLLADGFTAQGLVFLSYPLHPPGQPQRLRAAHLKGISVPMLFLQGSQDAFARMNLLRETVDELPTATLHVLDGADHGLRIKGRPEEEVIAELVDVTLAWIQGRKR